MPRGWKGVQLLLRPAVVGYVLIHAPPKPLAVAPGRPEVLRDADEDGVRGGGAAPHDTTSGGRAVRGRGGGFGVSPRPVLLDALGKGDLLQELRRVFGPWAHEAQFFEVRQNLIWVQSGGATRSATASLCVLLKQGRACPKALRPALARPGPDCKSVLEVQNLCLCQSSAPWHPSSPVLVKAGKGADTTQGEARHPLGKKKHLDCYRAATDHI